MSKENLLQFLGSVSSKANLEEELAKAGDSADKWVEAGRAAGFEFSKADLQDFISEALDQDVDEETMIEAFLSSEQAELSDEDLDKVAGGARGTIRRSLSRRIGSTLDSLGYFSGFGDQAVWYAPMGHDAIGQPGIRFKK